ncbi:AraC family transcriptional regulator [Chitinilyticum piscinae]|uniref:AraC family transcriptional regulator n=1 Tax=Chitinilyticum piscinae TaxID=2866724 RepID=A0A8J7FGN4_9NEIS|nr:AraC family transcriptional regulator [Chitinilyticum piscinae]MBE9607785.1 AraC family transcriptional regulator [Chitinilyticum piscinae]
MHLAAVLRQDWQQPVLHSARPRESALLDVADSRGRRIQRVMDYIEARLDAPLQLEELASLACFSPCHFDRVFHAATGEPPFEHIRLRRMLRAAQRVRHDTDTPIHVIARDCGFSSDAAFAKAFRRQFGMPAREWRRGGWRRYMDQVLGIARDGSTPVPEPAPHGRDGLAGRVQLRTLPAQQVVYRRWHGVGTDGLATQVSRYAGELAAADLLPDGGCCYGVMQDDFGLVGPAQFVFELAVPAPAAVPSTLVTRSLPGGLYALVEAQGMPVWFQWLYEDWLEGSAYTLDCQRPHLECHQRVGDTVQLRWLALPVRRLGGVYAGSSF